MSYRPRRTPLKFVLKTKQGDWVVLSARPWVPVGSTCVWLVCLAVSQSKRQINDWLNQRKNKRSKRLSKQMTGRSGMTPLLWAFNKVPFIEQHIPNWDGLFFWFDAIEKDKQRRVYMRWFERHNKMSKWKYVPNSDSFYYFKDPTVEYK